jgi:hypothetical protein
MTGSTRSRGSNGGEIQNFAENQGREKADHEESQERPQKKRSPDATTGTEEEKYVIVDIESAAAPICRGSL